MGRGRQYSWMNAGRKWEPCDNLQCFKPISISGDCFSLIPEEHLKAIIFVSEVVLSPNTVCKLGPFVLCEIKDKSKICASETANLQGLKIRREIKSTFPDGMGRNQTTRNIVSDLFYFLRQ